MNLFEEEDLGTVVEDPLAGLPRIQAKSEDQYRFAVGCREKMWPGVLRALREHEALVKQYEEAGDAQSRQLDEARAKLVSVRDRVELIRRTTAPGWWIERRKNSVQELLDNKPAKPGNSYGKKGSPS